MKKLISLVLAAVMVMSLTLAFAEQSYGATNAHKIEITSKGTGVHNYKAYQVFSGNLNAAEGILSDIKWGAGVNGPAILTDLIAANSAEGALNGKFSDLHEATEAQGTEGQEGYVPATAASSASDVAKAIAKLGDNSAALDAVARIIAEHLGTVAGTGATNGGSPNKATIDVSGDGYYFIQDTTEDLKEGDTTSKFLLQVVKDIKIEAKDTVLTPDKEILIKEGKASPEDCYFRSCYSCSGHNSIQRSLCVQYAGYITCWIDIHWHFFS